MPKETWPPMRPGRTPPAKVWRGDVWTHYGYCSSDFLVQLYTHEAAPRLSICRTSTKFDGRRLGDISWEELQAVKSAVGFGHEVACEVFPPDELVVDEANMRHLWLLKTGVLPVVWGFGDAKVPGERASAVEEAK